MTCDSAPLTTSKLKTVKKTLKRWVPSPVIQWATERRSAVWLSSRIKGWKLRHQSHDEVYGDDYFEMVDSTSGQSARIMATSIVEHLAPSTVVDLGCGTGNLMAELRELGVATKGVEFAEAALAYCRERGLDVVRLDFTDTGDLEETLGNYDLAVSSEVAIQLPPEAAPGYVDYLCRHADTVFFSSPPCARDRLPKSPQTAEHWMKQFSERGFDLDRETSEQLRSEWEQQGTAPWFHRQPMVFRRRGSNQG